jgi:hypothetical protein
LVYGGKLKAVGTDFHQFFFVISKAAARTAKGIYQSELIAGATGKQPKGNVLRNVLEPVTSPYLTGSAFWLFNDAFPLVDIAFLNGVQTPTVETAQADFNQLGIQMRCYYDYGAGAGEVKAACYSTGAEG